MMPENGLNVISVKWGSKYSAEYVNRLYSMVERNLSYAHTFYCLTDNAEGLEPQIRILDIGNAGLEGWWNKLLLFKNPFYGLKGTAVYFDLDVVITGSLDFIVEQPESFCIIKNWSRKKMWNSSVMRFEIGRYSHIWESFWKSKEDIVKKFSSDQEWIFQCVPDAGVFPAEKIISYKKSCDSKAFRFLDKFGFGRCGVEAPKFMKVNLPTDAAVVVFHGKPDPEDIMYSSYGLWKHAPFVADHWH